MDTINPHLLKSSSARSLPPSSFGHFPQDVQRRLCNHDWGTNDLETLCDAIYTLQAEDKLERCRETGLPFEYWNWSCRPERLRMWKAVDNLVSQLLLSWRGGSPAIVTAHEREPEATTSRSTAFEDSDVEADKILREIDDLSAVYSEADPRKFIVTRRMNARQRPQVHCIAHGKHLGHMTVGCGNLRFMLLSRNPHDLPRSLKDIYKKAQTSKPADQATRTDCICRHSDAVPGLSRPSTDDGAQTSLDWQLAPIFPPEDVQSFEDFNLALHEARLIPMQDSVQAPECFDEFSASGYSSADSLGSLYGQFDNVLHFDNQPAQSERDYLGRRKRKRQNGGYPCIELGCFEIFDRQCDLTQHQRSHLPYHQRPYPCEQCDKRFVFPKDLRRHERLHGQAAE